MFLEVAISKKSDSGIEITSKNLLPGMKLAYDISNILGEALLSAETVLTESIILSFKEIEKHRIAIGINPPTGRIYIHKSSIPNNALEIKSEPSDPVIAVKTTKPIAKENSIGPLQDNQASDMASILNKSKPSRPLILVVDDEPQVVNALKRELRRAGYDVEGFTKALMLYDSFEQAARFML